MKTLQSARRRITKRALDNSGRRTSLEIFNSVVTHIYSFDWHLTRLQHRNFSLPCDFALCLFYPALCAMIKVESNNLLIHKPFSSSSDVESLCNMTVKSHSSIYIQVHNYQGQDTIGDSICSALCNYIGHVAADFRSWRAPLGPKP